MKKTLIALLALAGMVQAAETPLVHNDLLASTDGWTLASLRNRSELFVIDTDAQAMSLTNSNWSQSYALYDFSDRPVCATADMPLSFSVTMETADAKAYTMALIGTDQTIVIGEDYDAAEMKYGVTDTVSGSVAYGFGSWGSAGYTKLDSADITTTTVDKATNTPITISGVSSFDAVTETYSLTLTFGASSYTITGLENLNVTALSFSGDGQNNLTNVKFSALSLSGATPEPATATLSLLALAGLASRRRRH